MHFLLLSFRRSKFNSSSFFSPLFVFVCIKEKRKRKSVVGSLSLSPFFLKEEQNTVATAAVCVCVCVQQSPGADGFFQTYKKKRFCCCAAATVFDRQADRQTEREREPSCTFFSLSLPFPSLAKSRRYSFCVGGCWDWKREEKKKEGQSYGTRLLSALLLTCCCFTHHHHQFVAPAAAASFKKKNDTISNFYFLGL